ncbi:MAG TPA: hypothetical protein VLE96_03010 [Chlamydiales bacterium]|nr:hypothetical protein [Chlamydiales bacterium]
MIYFGTRIFSHCVSTAIQRFKILIGKEVPSIDLPHIHLAVKVNDYVICEELLKKKFDPNILDQLGRKPLDLAQNESMVKLLKSYGALPSNRS